MDGLGRPLPALFIDPWRFSRPRGHEPAHVVCSDCPKPWHRIPYVVFFMPHHVRAHLRSRRDHRLAFWCEPCARLEGVIVTSDSSGNVDWPRDPLVRLGADSDAPVHLTLLLAVQWREAQIDRLRREIEQLQRAANQLPIRHRKAG